MTLNTRRAIAIISASLLSVAFISLLKWAFNIDDVSLIMMMVAFTSSANAVAIFRKLDKAN